MRNRWATVFGSCDPVSLVLALLIAAVASGCGSAPQRLFYGLSYPMESDRVTESRPPLHPVRLRIRPFQIALPYDRPQMVYRHSPYEFNYDPYRLWSSKPQQMLREMVEQHIRAQRLVLETTREFGDVTPAYELAAEVRAIEEFDAGDAWYGHLSIRFELVRFSDQAVIWRYDFDRKRRVHEQKQVLIVRALSEILSEELRRVTAEIDRVLSVERGVQATLPMPDPVEDDASVPVIPTPDGRASSSPKATGARQPGDAVAPAAARLQDDELIVPDEEGGR